MSEILLPMAIVGGCGLMFGCLLAVCSVIFKVERDGRIEQIEKILPGANCGACGYAGCAAYAEAIVSAGAGISGCSVGKGAVAEKIAEIMGKTAEKTEPGLARVMCAGKCGIAEDKYEYSGIRDCVSAAKLAGGAKTCENGCLGLGSCVRACKFGAMDIIDRVARVDENKCTGCGMCVKACPKHIIEIVPADYRVLAPCANTDRGADTGRYCRVGCIGCRICEKNCPTGAVTVLNNHAVIDYGKCTACGICADKCPRRLIRKRKN